MSDENRVQMIPVEKIRILNPRVRNKRKYEEIVTSISELGLKRPITVSRRIEDEDDDGYDLVCGQGRLEAYVNLGQTEVPALVISVSRQDRLIMSLVENIARRNPPTYEHVKHLAYLRDVHKYTPKEIGQKTGISYTYVTGLLGLFDRGENRLLQEVEKGRVPISVAVFISGSNDEELQKALTEAYEKKQINASNVIYAKKLMERRKLYGKTMGSNAKRKKQMTSSESVVRAYQLEAQKQKLLLKKAKLCETRLLFIINALGVIVSDDNFINLLRAEGLDTMPQYLAEKIGRKT